MLKRRIWKEKGACCCMWEWTAKKTKEKVFIGGVQHSFVGKAAYEERRVDVKTAFFQAPNQRQKLLVVARRGEPWLALKALYDGVL